MSFQDSETLHATALSIRGNGLLLVGASGSGKSDLALRCLSLPMGPVLASPFELVSDDQVIVTRSGDDVLMSAPAAIAGQLEVRGVGICEFPFASQARLCLIAQLSLTAAERYPDLEPRTQVILGQAFRVIDVHPFEASAPIKLALALDKFAAATDRKP